MVAPVMIGKANPLYCVYDVYNAILVRGNMLGDVMFYGAGAGKLPTASAVVSDVVDAIKHTGSNIVTLWSNHKRELSDRLDAVSEFFVRVPVEEKDKAIALFGEAKEVKADGVDGEYAFVTDVLSERDFEEKAGKLNVISRIRCEFKRR
jgi:homoserine dehydrogenase